MKKIFILFIIVSCFSNLKAQYVTIPDPNFVSWLQTHVSSAMNGNQMDTTSNAVINRVDIYVPDYAINDLTGIQYFDGLKILDCSSYGSGSPNNLTSLPKLPSSLDTLRCQGNSLTNLPELPDSLKELSCSLNLINILSGLPNGLKSLICVSNQLISIPSLPQTLTLLACSDNQLLNLPSLPYSLQTLICSNNQIGCFPLFPPSITYIEISNNPFTCLPNYISSMDALTLNYPLCASGGTVNQNGCPQTGSIIGSVYYDYNIDCMKNNNETTLLNAPLKLYNNIGTLIQQSSPVTSGSFYFSAPAGSYYIVLDTTNKPYSVFCTHPGIDTSFATITNNQIVDSLDFAISCKPGFDIGTQSIYTNGWVFPGQKHQLNIRAGDMSKWYGLNCANGISGQVIVTVTGNVTYLGPGPGALTPIVSGNTFTYNISDFAQVNNISDFKLYFKTNTTAQSGDTISVNVIVNPSSGDNNLVNNSFKYYYNVVNSHDPNKKETYPTNVSPGYSDYLTYTIHFQNTGTAPAFNISLIDTLDTQLDQNTFEIINYSHSNIIQLTGNKLIINFSNINLPDSTHDFNGSQGFLQYRIKPKATWVAPYKIKNTAYIYFDYNTPIVTNTTYNSILTTNGLNEIKETITTLFPNPTNGSFTIEINTKEKQTIQLFDVTGNSLLSQTIENGKGTIDASHLSAGVYNVSIKGNTSVINKKVVIVK